MTTMPDANGNFKGIAVPRLPWLEELQDVVPEPEDEDDDPKGTD